MTQDAIPTRLLVRAAVGFAVYLVLGPALLFTAAGTLRWPMAWVLVVLMLLSTVGSRLVTWQRNPDLLRERARYTSGEGAQAWDKLLVNIVALVGPMILMVVIGLDHRFGWSPALPPWVQIAGAVVVAAGYSLAVWAMIANRYFSAVARIQRDRGQVVVTHGPYRLVRHPAYAGSFFASLAMAFMFSALWALVPAVLLNAVLAVRTHLEDRMLQADLEGYKAYAARTRYRLIPGLW